MRIQECICVEKGLAHRESCLDVLIILLLGIIVEYLHSSLMHASKSLPSIHPKLADTGEA